MPHCSERNVGWIIAGVLILIGLLVNEVIMRVVIVPKIVPHFERAPNFRIVKTEPDSDAIDVTFTTSDGFTLQGCHYHHPSDSRGVIIFCHEVRGSRWMAMHYTEALFKAGFDVLSFDFRNHGDSEVQPGYEPLHWATEFEVDDLKSAIRFVKNSPELQHLPIGLFGVSRGGTVALAVASEIRDIECVICDSTFTVESLMSHYAKRWAELFVPPRVLNFVPDFHVERTIRMVRRRCERQRNVKFVETERTMPKLRDRKVLFICGSSDSYVPTEVGERLSRLVPGSEIWHVPKAKHNGARLVAQEEYDRRVLAAAESISVAVPS